MPNEKQLNEKRFDDLWTRNRGIRAREVFGALRAHYDEAHRHYHNGAHIIDCLSRFDLARAQPGHDDAAELAIWFHDVIYQCGAPDNEAKSAEWFIECADGHLDAQLMQAVHECILATMHRDTPPNARAKLVVDVDLSGMGMSAESFQHDGENIRREFAHLNDADFNRGQNAFLQSLIARDYIYYTDFFREHCEVRARKNIAELFARTA